MIEKEKKILIDEKTFENVLNQYSWDKEFVQINFYYDSKMYALLNMDVNIRVRGIKDRLYLQAKIKEEIDNNVITSTEYEKELKELPHCIKGEEIRSLCHSDRDFPDVYLLGFLQTERRVLNSNGLAEFTLDVNWYLGTCDYEIEIEYTDENELNKIIKKLQAMEIPVETKSICKKERFYNRYIEKLSKGGM